MLVKEVKAIAADRGVKAGKMKKAELIRAIQEAEGNNTCFQSEIAPTCGEEGCLWRADCIPSAK